MTGDGKGFDRKKKEKNGKEIEMNISIDVTRDGTRYFITNDNGGNICFFDSMVKAGTVLRYLQGADMLPEDCARAVDAMRDFDKMIAARHAEREAQRALRREIALQARKATIEQSQQKDIIDVNPE